MTEAELALAFVKRPGKDMKDVDNPIEVCSLGRTLLRWKHQIAVWHSAHVSNGPTEAVIVIKRVKRAAFFSPAFATIGSGHLSMPENQTGPYSQGSYPIEIRRAINRKLRNGSQARVA